MAIRLEPQASEPQATSGAAIGRTSETGQSASVGARGADRGAGRSSSTDTVQISGPSSALNHLAAERVSRIDQLTALVQGGSYDISSARVGRSIVSDAVSGGA